MLQVISGNGVLFSSEDTVIKFTGHLLCGEKQFPIEAIITQLAPVQDGPNRDGRAGRVTLEGRFIDSMGEDDVSAIINTTTSITMPDTYAIFIRRVNSRKFSGEILYQDPV